MPRNRELMRVFKDVGLVEQLGSGMSRILSAYSKDIFHISDHFIKVVFPFSEVANRTGDNIGDNNGDNVGDNELVVDILRATPDITARELSRRSLLSTRTISRIMKTLRENGKITRIGSPRKGYWQINEDER